MKKSLACRLVPAILAILSLPVTSLWGQSWRYLGQNLPGPVAERPAAGIFRVIRNCETWSAPEMVSLPIPGGKRLGKQFSLSGNGNLYAELDNSQGTDLDLYVWPQINGQFKNAVKLSSLCSVALEGFPTIIDNERFIVLSSNRNGGFGSFDLYISCKDDDDIWSQPVNLGDAGTRYEWIPKQPYLGQVPPGTTPEKFAPDIVSATGLREYSLTLSSDSTELYFYRFGEGIPSKLYVCRYEKGMWTAPAEFGPSAGHPASEPCITPDNRRLYFLWDTGGGSGIPQYYLTERNSSGWSSPVLAGNGMFLSASAEGQLYTTDVSVLFTTGRTYLAKIQTTAGGLFSRLDPLLIQPNYGNQAHPCIAPDGRYILFDIDGGSHLFVSFRKADGSWGTAIDLANHGFSKDAGGAVISPDGKYLFFHLNGDIWWVDSKVIENLNPFTGGSSALQNTGFELYQNSPNPCRDYTRISFSMEKPGDISLDLYSSNGIRITRLVSNRFFMPGKQEFNFNLSSLSPGIYTYVLSNGSSLQLSRRMVVSGK